MFIDWGLEGDGLNYLGGIWGGLVSKIRHRHRLELDRSERRLSGVEIPGARKRARGF